MAKKMMLNDKHYHKKIFCLAFGFFDTKVSKNRDLCFLVNSAFERG